MIHRHLAHLVFQCNIYVLDIVVTIQNVEVFYHLLVGDVALAEAGSLVEDGESVSGGSGGRCGDGGGWGGRRAYRRQACLQ